MDHHILYHQTTRAKMTARMILNRIMASRKRLALALILAVVFVDICIITAPRQAAAPAKAAPGDEPVQAWGRGRQRRRPAPWPHAAPDREPDGMEELPETAWMPAAAAQPDSREAWERLNEVDVGSAGQNQPKPLEPLDPLGPTPRRRLEVEAGEEHVDVKLDGESLMVPDPNNRTRGLHVVVLDQDSGAVMARRRFDTVLSEVHEEALHFLDAVRPGRVLVMATKDDMSFKMHSDLRLKLTQLGSQFIPDLRFRDQWAMVALQGAGEALGETFSPAPTPGEYGGPLFLRVDLALGSLPATPPCRWPASEESRRRHQFCDQVEGYPGVCRCLQPHAILPQPSSLEENIDSIFVAVMATHRPYYLYRSLRSLAFAHGSQTDNIVVYLENDHNPELEALVSLFGFKVRYVAPKSHKSINMVIGNRVMDILSDVFTTFMEAEYVLFIEEDLECSPDIFRYFGQTRPLLEEDPTLLSVQAMNLQSRFNTSHATDTAYRVDDFNGVGFLLSRKIYEGEVKPAWPEYAWKSDWDIFIDKIIRHDREVIVPDVNRVYHVGRDSFYVNTELYDAHYKNMSANPDPMASLKDVSRLHKLKYEEDLTARLQKAVIIREYKDICLAENMTTNFQHQNLTEVVFFQMESKTDRSTWSYLAKCWGLWPSPTTGQHGGLWRFWMENKKGFFFHMVFIGVPFSRYSSFKPSDLEPYRAPAAGTTSTSSPDAAAVPPSSASSRSSAAPAGGQQPAPATPSPSPSPSPSSSSSSSSSPSPSPSPAVKPSPTVGRTAVPAASAR